MSVLTFTPVEIKSIDEDQYEAASLFIYDNWQAIYKNVEGSEMRRDQTYFLDMLRKHKSPIWAAYFNNRIIGITITLSNCVDYIIVDNDFRNRKIGTKLLNKAAEYLRSKGFKHMQVGIEDFNKAAYCFFTSLGWEKIGSEYINLSKTESVEAFVLTKGLSI